MIIFLEINYSMYTWQPIDTVPFPTIDPDVSDNKLS